MGKGGSTHTIYFCRLAPVSNFALMNWIAMAPRSSSILLSAFASFLFRVCFFASRGHRFGLQEMTICFLTTPSEAFNFFCCSRCCLFDSFSRRVVAGHFFDDDLGRFPLM